MSFEGLLMLLLLFVFEACLSRPERTSRSCSVRGNLLALSDPAFEPPTTLLLLLLLFVLLLFALLLMLLFEVLFDTSSVDLRL